MLLFLLRRWFGSCLPACSTQKMRSSQLKRVVIPALQMGKSMQRESTESAFPQKGCSSAQRKCSHVLTQKSSHRAFKRTGRNGLKCRGKGNGCSRRTSGCASLCHVFSSLPTHIKDKYFQLSEQLIFSSKVSENLEYELCMLISFFSVNKSQCSILKRNLLE